MATIRGPKIVTSGLILALDAADKKSYSGSGTAWNDLSGNNRTAVLQNSPIFSANNCGYFDFNGSSQYGVITLSPTISLATFTYSIWAYQGFQTGYRTLIDQNNDNWWFGVHDGVVKSYAPNFNTGYSISLNRWYHFVMAHTVGGPARFYVNESLIYTSTNDSTSYTISYIGVGAAGNPGVPNNEVWQGRISNMQIYNKELSASEIKQNFNATRGRFGI